MEVTVQQHLYQLDINAAAHATVFDRLIAVAQIVAALRWSPHTTRLKTINLCFMRIFDIKISVSRHTFFYLKCIIAAAINQ